jgi:hypothetical protein
MTIQEILDQLQYCRGAFPYQTVAEAAARKDEIVPELLKILEEARLLPEALNDDSYLAPLYAMFLLAQFREKKAYPAIIEFLSVPDKMVMDYLGESGTEDVSRILASVAHGDTQLIKSLVENKAVDEYLRAAALKALLTQVVHGEVTRDEVVAYFQGLFRGGLEREPSVVWNDLVCDCVDLHPEELIEDIRQAYQEDLIDEWWIDLEGVEKALAGDKESALKDLQSDAEYRYIENVAEEMSHWDCFNTPVTRNPLESGPPLIKTGPTGPIVAKKKIGRNEPCPCGSGKKYKKCCGKT